MCVVQEDPLEKSPDPPGFRREDPFDQDEMDEQECLHACMLFVVGASTGMTMVCFVPTYASYPVQTMPRRSLRYPRCMGPRILMTPFTKRATWMFVTRCQCPWMWETWQGLK